MANNHSQFKKQVPRILRANPPVSLHDNRHDSLPVNQSGYLHHNRPEFHRTSRLLAQPVLPLNRACSPVANPHRNHQENLAISRPANRLIALPLSRPTTPRQNPLLRYFTSLLLHLLSHYSSSPLLLSFPILNCTSNLSYRLRSHNHLSYPLVSHTPYICISLSLTTHQLTPYPAFCTTLETTFATTNASACVETDKPTITSTHKATHRATIETTNAPAYSSGK